MLLSECLSLSAPVDRSTIISKDNRQTLKGNAGWYTGGSILHYSCRLEIFFPRVQRKHITKSSPTKCPSDVFKFHKWQRSLISTICLIMIVEPCHNHLEHQGGVRIKNYTWIIEIRQRMKYPDQTSDFFFYSDTRKKQEDLAFGIIQLRDIHRHAALNIWQPRWVLPRLPNINTSCLFWCSNCATVLMSD